MDIDPMMNQVQVCPLHGTTCARYSQKRGAIARSPYQPAVLKGGNGTSPKVLWDVVRAAATRAGIERLAPHDLRRTCARLCHLAGGELDQIQFLRGHVSIQTTKRCLRCKQKLRIAVNERMGLIGAGSLVRPLATTRDLS
jgi:integrase